jgi:hypothetical protein
MQMTIGCSHEECTKFATRQTTVAVAGERSEGERVLLWVCNDHAKLVEPGPRARRPLVRRVLAAANLRSV